MKEAVAMLGRMQEVEYRSDEVEVMVEIIGVDPDDVSVVFGEVVKTAGGRYVRENDYKTCTVGHIFARDYFNSDIGVNDRLRINGSKFRVVGILKEQGGFRSEVDSAIYVTKRDAANILDTRDISEIFVRVRILFLFLMEAGVVSGIGGVFGCVLGIVAGKVISFGIATEFGLEIAAIFPPLSLLLAFAPFFSRTSFHLCFLFHPI